MSHIEKDHGWRAAGAKVGGGSAFPSQEIVGLSLDGNGASTPLYSATPGMTLHDYYAGQAFPTILARLYQVADRNGGRFENVYAIAAAASLEAADAMLEARDK